MAKSIDESTFNQIASKREGQSKILRLLDELAAHYQTLWGLGGESESDGILVAESQSPGESPKPTRSPSPTYITGLYSHTHAHT